ncbi:Elongator subunit elp6 [Entomortierella lignicola]|nr:Elongator subunit elp6 [Entomortierella lignicola]
MSNETWLKDNLSENRDNERRYELISAVEDAQGQYGLEFNLNNHIHLLWRRLAAVNVTQLYNNDASRLCAYSWSQMYATDIIGQSNRVRNPQRSVVHNLKSTAREWCLAQNNHNVVLVGLAGILVHYTMIGRKLGVNLTTAKTKGNFHFVDGLTQLTDYAAPNKDFLPKPVEVKTSGDDTPTLPLDSTTGLAAPGATPRIVKPATSTPAPVILSFSSKLINFYKFLEEHINSIIPKNNTGQGKQLCLILDDLSVLLNCGWPCRDVLALVRYLKLLVAKVNGSLITVVHADSVLAEEVSQDGLVKGVFYEADYIIDVRGLDSGGSRDVHGQLSLLHGPGYLLRQRAGEVKENEWPALTLHYKILDNNVEVFAKGYSSGVL